MRTLGRRLFTLQRHNWILFSRFALVGASGVLVNMLVTVVAHKLHGGTQHSRDAMFPIPGTDWSFRYFMFVWLLGFCVANLTNFQLNRTWTFDGVRHASWWREFRAFFVVGGVVALLGLFIKTAFVTPGSPVELPRSIFTGDQGITDPDYWAQLLTILVTMPLSFVANKLWTFASLRHHPDEPASMLAPVVAPELVSDDLDHAYHPRDERSAYESTDRHQEMPG